MLKTKKQKDYYEFNIDDFINLNNLIMPNFDHKGPGGLGPKTGNKLGKCRKTSDEKKEFESNYSYNKEIEKNLCGKQKEKLK